MPSIQDIPRQVKTKQPLPFDPREPKFDRSCNDPLIKRVKNKCAADQDTARSHDQLQPKDVYEKRVTAPRQLEIMTHVRPMQF